jgi:hypothetical protein
MYEDRISMFKRDAPGQVKGYLDEVEKMSDEAVAQKKPLILYRRRAAAMKWATDKLVVLGVIDPEAAKPLQARQDAIRPTLPQKEASLRNEHHRRQRAAARQLLGAGQGAARRAGEVRVEGEASR